MIFLTLKSAYFIFQEPIWGIFTPMEKLFLHFGKSSAVNILVHEFSRAFHSLAVREKERHSVLSAVQGL